MGPDLIVVNGDIRTLDPSQPRATGLVSLHGELVFVGRDQEALAMRAPETRVIDVGKRLVLPGFTDAHIHFAGFAQSLFRVNLEGCRSIEEATERVAARAATAKPGETILGGGWNHIDWAIPSFPDKSPLDSAAPNNPVILTRKDGHSAWVNSAALDQAGITARTPDPEGGKLERDAKGEPTGLVRESALDLLGKGIGKSDEEIPEQALMRAVDTAHRAGLTTIHNIEGPNALRAWQKLHEQGKLNLRVVHSIPAASLDHALELGLRRRFGDDRLRLQAVKVFADGSLGSQTAEMSAPFVGTDKTGMVLTGSTEMVQLSRAAARNGLDVWIHAIGDSAIGRALDVFQTLRAEGLDTIFRIEHVQHVNPSDLERFAKLNVVASVQPIHQPSDMRMADEYLGTDRARWSYAFNSLVKAGAVLAFGSDCPVEGLEPLRGIYAAVTRQNEEGLPPGGWFPEERLTIQSAIEAYTRGGAIAAGDESCAGRLARGYYADAVILSQNLFLIPLRDIQETLVDYTIVAGQVVYCRPDQAGNCD